MTDHQPQDHYDLAIVGAGIIGLAHALAAVRIGKKVIVIDRDAVAKGASVRNFGFVTVSGQQSGQSWQRALRTRDIWADVAAEAGIRIAQSGSCIVARRPEAFQLLQAFAETDMGRACEIITPDRLAETMPAIRSNNIRGALWSPHELRVESRDAIPQLARWLAAVHGVSFLRSAEVRSVAPPLIETTRGQVRADKAVICCGDDLQTLFPERLAAYDLVPCRLQMMRVMPGLPMPLLPASLMSDLSLVRQPGFASLAGAKALSDRLKEEQARYLQHGIHLVAVQSVDGSLVVGDSHHYGGAPNPTAPSEIEGLILDELDAVLDLGQRRVTERWVGTYATASDRPMLVDRPSADIRIVIVTSGSGASTGFAIGEEMISEMFGDQCAA
jgi:FAD dependent oxidoreductase TIGR03364